MGLVLHVRFDEETKEAIEKSATAMGVQQVDFVKLAVREKLARIGLLDEKVKKILKV